MADTLKLLSTAEYPPLLNEIPDSPRQLYVRGKLPPFTHKWLAVVGSRAVTPYGRQVVSHLIEGLRGFPVVIVSGLAYGVDAAAHKSALENNLPTVAVPGSGLDWGVLYPRANVNLAREILKSDGAHLSEFEPNFKATDWSFPQRNRIMAGMSHATLIVEAREKSGSLITARLTTEYNRDLLVVPGSIFSAESRGTHQFLKLGATPITSAEDLRAALGFTESTPSAKSVPKDLTPSERRVFDILSSPLPRETLINALSMPISDVNILLSTMEMKGLIVEEIGLVRLR